MITKVNKYFILKNQGRRTLFMLFFKGFLHLFFYSTKLLSLLYEKPVSQG